ncbi:hypothetical protein [Sphingopyxis sp. GW247-27LB]|uniref:hypothetical protein n=1 Tax=Sphingopyxis sp. GW247-27LB TaxID=2012632 RepID=UPI000BA7452A|nr:hypothetical protein [Sphingopyxis sp. GW247-27LB]PAL20183.1 hypothetical protein CD928_17390 [Sphingopyxis sp. GW247-27LB]
MATLPDRILWLALVTLAELVERVNAAPARPHPAARLALAVCYAHSKGDREPFDHFWRMMQDPHASQSSEETARYCRTTYLMTALRGVLRAVGIEPTVQVEIALRDAARKGLAA